MLTLHSFYAFSTRFIHETFHSKVTGKDGPFLMGKVTVGHDIKNEAGMYNPPTSLFFICLINVP